MKFTSLGRRFSRSSTPAAPNNVIDGLVELQRRLQHEFSNASLLRQALTHRSFSSDHNERLEFLGDSVLNLTISDLLYSRLDSLPEGDLSRVRANLVKKDTLYQLALDLKLPEVLKVGEGAVNTGVQKRPNALSDALEAVIGAVYLDAGFAAAQALVHRLFNAVEINPQMEAIGRDPKTELQEWLQGRKMKLPVYKVVGTLGAAHKQSFDVECEIPELRLAERGIGGSRRSGEQAAAAAMLQTLKSKAR